MEHISGEQHIMAALPTLRKPLNLTGKVHRMAIYVLYRRVVAQARPAHSGVEKERRIYGYRIYPATYTYEDLACFGCWCDRTVFSRPYMIGYSYEQASSCTSLNNEP